MNPTKKSFLTSMIALVLCLTMFLGTTFAWFTDMVTSSGNIIQTGSLKIDLELLDKETGKWNSIKDSQSPLFDYEKWEPGYVDVKVLKVENEGNLSLKWKAMFVSDEQLSALADVIDVYVLPWGVGNGEGVGYPADRKLDGYTKVGTLKDFVNTIESTTYGTLKGGEAAYLGIALKMQDEAGNDYQQLSLGKFNIQIVATQAVGESDSFDNNYDANAQWPELESGYSASTAVDTTKLILGALTEEMTIGGNNGVGAIIPADVKVAEGATSLELTMNKVEDNFVLGDNVSSFDVHISGIATDNEKPMRVDLGAVLATGLADTELKLYHIENGTAVQMTRVATVSDFAIHNQYTYDPTTGNVSIYVKSFSVFSAVSGEASKWSGNSYDISWYKDNESTFTLKDAMDFAGFGKLVDEGKTFEGKTVKLGVDIDLNNINFDPIGFGYGTVFSGTFDGQNHTIYNLKQNGWELGYSYGTQGGGLFASVKDATIKNLAISGADIKMECVDMGILVGYAYGTCTFQNITIANSTIANYNRYTGGVVGEVNGNHTFKDIVVDSTVTISSLWGSFDTPCGGVIGGKYGKATVTMENVTVACELDVFSDVTSAYQWYAYRRCGMLIGHTEQDSPKEAATATADFLTCTNVKVYYGDWVNYTYCEFEHTNNPGYNYPWVRVQAGLNNAAYSNPRYGNPVDSKGNKVTSDTHTHASGEGCKVSIPFNQLYGGGQGVYGESEHNGVTVSHKLTKTIYFKNEWNWNADSIKIYYWYEHTTTVNGKAETHTWNNVAFPGTSMEKVGKDGSYDLYKFEVPVFASGVVINGTFESKTVQTVNIAIDKVPENTTLSPVLNKKYIKDNGGENMTVYLRNDWWWTDVRVHHWGVTGVNDSNWPGATMTKVGWNGSYDIYAITINENSKFLFDGLNNGNRDQSPDITSGAFDGAVYYMHWDGSNKVDILSEQTK